MNQRTVRIFDTTLRDGEQTPGVHLNLQDKVRVAQALEAAGVDTIEAGFPASSRGDFEAVEAVSRAVRRCEVAALARCVPGDIEAAAAALRPAVAPVIHVVLGVSDIHLQHKLRITRARAIQVIAESVGKARNAVPEVEFSLEDATRADAIFRRQCVQAAVAAGATRINLADTVGCALPGEMAAMISDLVAFTANKVIVSAHCHNDLGLATANTVAAVEAGASQVEVTVNGIGERAGNAALEEVGAILRLKRIAECRFDLRHACGLSKLVAELTRVQVQPNRAIVGANAFTHSSGIHQDGILKHPQNYEFVPPAAVGASGHQFVLTARSGRKAVEHVARQQGHVLSADQLERVYERFLRAADHASGEVKAEDLERIIRTVLREAALAVKA